MDFKGITWAGNIYQKFEAMCLEVEEAMYKDTVNYVENQVQKVGVTIKKFYSEVMEDLVPPSCVYPINLTSGDLSLNPYGHTNFDKKLKPGVHHSLENENEDQPIFSVTAEKESFRSGCYDINSLSPKSHGISVQNKCSNLSTKVGIQRRRVGIKRISKNNHPSKDSCQIMSLSKVASGDVRSSSSGPSDDINVISPLSSEANRDPGEAANGNACIFCTPIMSPASDKISGNESLRQKEHDTGCISPVTEKTESVGRNNVHSDSTSPAFGSNLVAESERLKGDSGSVLSCSGLPTESTGASMNHISFSALATSFRSMSGNLESEEEVMLSNAESLYMEMITSNEDSFKMEVIKNKEFSVPRQENMKPVYWENLEESCILVEGDKLHCIPHEARKHKSYKRKIREALSSKLRSRKDDQCISAGKDLGRKNDRTGVDLLVGVDSVKQKLPVDDSFESDWELL